jgi:hypothetical protein
LKESRSKVDLGSGRVWRPYLRQNAANVPKWFTEGYGERKATLRGARGCQSAFSSQS